jgi:hypothetical protein
MKISILKIISLSIITSIASAATLQCPPSIKTQQSLQGRIDGWDAYLDDLNGMHNFSRITFYDKHPKEHASLASDAKAKKNQLVWNFDASEIWLVCEYTNTNVQLTQKLPSEIKKCTVTYDANFTQVTDINCI